jgi:hypothetical protein
MRGEGPEGVGANVPGRGHEESEDATIFGREETMHQRWLCQESLEELFADVHERQ